MVADYCTVVLPATHDRTLIGIQSLELRRPVTPVVLLCISCLTFAVAFTTASTHSGVNQWLAHSQSHVPSTTTSAVPRSSIIGGNNPAGHSDSQGGGTGTLSHPVKWSHRLPPVSMTVTHHQAHSIRGWQVSLLAGFCAFIYLAGRLIFSHPRRHFAMTALVAQNLETPIVPVSPEDLANAPKRVAIVGGGPAGLALALGLAKRGWPSVTIFDKRPAPPSPDDQSVFGDNFRHYMIGISGRGQRALRRLGVMSAIDESAHMVRGRMDWNPESGTEVSDGKLTDNSIQKGYTTRTIQRDRLAAVLQREVQNFSDQVHLRYETEVTDVHWEPEGSTSILSFPDGSTEMYDLVVGADGIGSVVRDALERDGELRVERYKDDNIRIYKTIPMYTPPDWRGDLNYSCRTKSGLNLDALPTAEGPYIGVLLFRPGCKLMESVHDAASARKLFDTYFPMFSPLITDEDLATFAAKPPSKLPVFRTVHPRLHRRQGGACLIGDCIHTVKPYFGLGVNSAFEDVTALLDCFTAAKEDPVKGTEIYSKFRAEDARALVQLSHSFDRPGLGTFVYFVLPLILDGIFSSAFPQIFAPNSLRLLQDPNLSFSSVAKRKRRDRILQGVILFIAFAAALWSIQWGCRALFKLLTLLAGSFKL